MFITLSLITTPEAEPHTQTLLNAGRVSVDLSYF